MKQPTYILLATILLAACGGESASNADPSADATANADTGADISDESDDVVDEPICEGVELGVDSDGDGLEDALEDANLNCVVDDGETDPFDTDSDGDGLEDGYEDVDQNGVWDQARGELDPRNEDTDGDGVTDDEEQLSLICSSRLLENTGMTRFTIDDEFAVYVDEETVEALVLPETGALLYDEERTAATVLLTADLRDPLELLALVRESAAALSAEIGTISEWAGGPDEDEWAAELELVLSANTDVSGLAMELIPIEGLPPVLIPPGEYRVRIDTRRTAEGTLRAAVSFAPEALDDWAAATGLGALSPIGATQLRAMCEELTVLDREDLDILLVIDSSERITDLRDAAFDAIDRVLRARIAHGLSAEVWLATADAHTYGAAGALVRDQSFASVTEMRDALAPFLGTEVDQRPWNNARLALGFLESMDLLSDNILVVVVVGEEDAEFRYGMYEGRDGSPEEPPLPAGDERDLLTAYYAEQLGGFDAQVVTLAPWTSGTRSEFECPVNAFGAVPSMGRSYADLTRRLGGAYINACATDAGAAIETALQRIAGAAASMGLSQQAVVPTISVVLDGVAGSPEWVEVDGMTEAFVETDQDIVGVSYLFWDSSVSSQRRR